MITTIASRYGVDYCTECDLALPYCRCPITIAARALAPALLPNCIHCQRSLADCNADRAGCGSGVARDGA